jgi:signal transduction histidine kinase/ActR/RegA family two-component response regulator
MKPSETGLHTAAPATAMGVRGYLVWLLLAALVPVMIFAAYLLWRDARAQREAAQSVLLDNAFALRVALDRELQVAMSALETLRHSDPLERDDVEAFQSVARRVKADHPNWLTIALIAPNGQTLFNLAARPGQELPNLAGREVIQRIMKSHMPEISELSVGAVAQSQVVAIDVPVLRGRELHYILGVTLPVAKFGDLLRPFAETDGRVAAIVDNKNVVVVRSDGRDETIGQPAELLAQDSSKLDSVLAHRRDHNGAKWTVAISRSKISGWAAIVAIPDAVLDKPLERSLAELIGGFAVLLTAIMFIALAIGRRITRPIEHLAGAADDYVRGDEGIAAERSGVEEVDRLTSALRHSGAMYRQALAEREKAEASLQHAQKLEALGQLTGGIAHDFNNLLNVFSNGVQVLERTDDPARRELVLGAMGRAALRGASLTRQLATFARNNSPRADRVDLAACVEDVRELMASSLRSNVEIVMKFPEDLWPVEADASDLELAIVNMALNARDAMPKGGVLTIAAENVAGLKSPELDGDYVRLMVNDNGAGMSAEVRSRAFEPFFTTKEMGKATGLGLSQVYGFVRQSGGTVHLHSEPGHGTMLTLYLPRFSRDTNRTSDMSVAQPNSKRTLRVLLVDDDDEVASLAAEMIKELGHDVRRVANGAKAIEVLDSSEPLDLVFSDVVMPGGISGIDVALEIWLRRPGLPVVLATGFPDALREAEADKLQVLPKPYNLQGLAAAFEAALKRRTGP